MDSDGGEIFRVGILLHVFRIFAFTFICALLVNPDSGILFVAFVSHHTNCVNEKLLSSKKYYAYIMTGESEKQKQPAEGQAV